MPLHIRPPFGHHSAKFQVDDGKFLVVLVVDDNLRIRREPELLAGAHEKQIQVDLKKVGLSFKPALGLTDYHPYSPNYAGPTQLSHNAITSPRTCSQALCHSPWDDPSRS